ncbi:MULTISPECIES: hypothetical protein [Pseudoalteromonas]|uniref:hypothetical protein n=1 Tax=Pseudoalteromonas TaxID=53246 RepID=UPI001583DD36|nr:MULTISPECIES: hypothetical protein [Pseudoalteromonas]MDI4654255.1 hypothetical protein [Pseudoalteromonas shioyasakiensis]NUJ40209.1 hypothetical protein [Pseudoalteromonas sp. 0303]
MALTVTSSFITTLRKARTAVLRFNGDATVLEIEKSFHKKTFREDFDVHFASHRQVYGSWVFMYLSGDAYSITDNISVLAHFLKRGDVLQFTARDNSSESLRSKNMETMQVVAVISRLDRNGEQKNRFELVVGSQTVEKTNCARNIQRIV